MTMRRFMQIVESESAIRHAHIPRNASRAFGHKGYDRPIAASDPRIVRDEVPFVGDDDANKRLAVAKRSHSASLYATRMNTIYVERGDHPRIFDRHQAEHDRLEREWTRWKVHGLLD